MREKRRGEIFLRAECWNSSRVVTCRELDRSRRESVKKKRKERKKEKKKEKREEDNRRRRTCEPTVLARRSNPEVPRDLPVFATSRYSFQNILQIFCSQECVYFTPTPRYTTPRIRVRGKKTESKNFLSTFHARLGKKKKTIFETTIESNSLE